MIGVNEGQIMADTRFTPGPWSVEDPMDCELSIVEANKPTHEWRFIAGCSLPDGDDDQAFTGREVYANAHLIAAAPELYEALERLLPCVGSPVPLKDTADRVRRAVAAVQKARGE